jgi:hypothetical protein
MCSDKDRELTFPAEGRLNIVLTRIYHHTSLCSLHTSISGSDVRNYPIHLDLIRSLVCRQLQILKVYGGIQPSVCPRRLLI